MAAIDSARIHDILAAAHAEGRSSLFEHECYRLLEATGAEAAPVSRLIPIGERPRASNLEHLRGEKVVLKVVSPDITHKTEARGVRIVAREIGAVEAAFDLMLREVPEAYAAYLERHAGEMPDALAGRRGRSLEQRLADRMVGILLCSFMPPDAQGFATELFVGIRQTAEFGPIISAGLGGVEMELLARQTRKGAAVVIAPTGTVDGGQLFRLFTGTLSYERLSGAMRGSRRLLEDAILVECFQAFIDLANHFSAVNPGAAFHIEELEVNPFSSSGGRLAPLDGDRPHRPPPQAAHRRRDRRLRAVPQHGPHHPRQHLRRRLRPRRAAGDPPHGGGDRRRRLRAEHRRSPAQGRSPGGRGQRRAGAGGRRGGDRPRQGR
ncbi:MAG: acetate--CoA ligase family protein, partial [Thermoanaerobaculales bacterium]|nr:acetate--CoA ligase family protein [Thermoanaerobaculales bacterium]